MCKITHVSASNLVLTFSVDGVPQPPLVIPNSSSSYAQSVFRTPVYKGKLYKLRIASPLAFRLDGRDSFIEVKDWASDGMYSRLRVFGDFSLIEG
jgi:hypothetical protein